MQEAEGVAPVLETEVRSGNQDVEVAGVVETHLKIVILIELEKVDSVRELLADLLEVRPARILKPSASSSHSAKSMAIAGSASS